MLDEQLTSQQLQDGFALKALMAHETMWPALQRAVLAVRDDAVRKFGNEDGLSRKWLKGVVETCELLLKNIEEAGENASDVEVERRQVEAASRSVAADGRGTGDLAV
jgi:hypothetical protein